MCCDLPECFQSGEFRDFGRQATSLKNGGAADNGEVGDELLGVVEQDDIPVNLVPRRSGQFGCGIRHLRRMPSKRWRSGGARGGFRRRCARVRGRRGTSSSGIDRFHGCRSSLPRMSMSKALVRAGYHRTAPTTRLVVLPRDPSKKSLVDRSASCPCSMQPKCSVAKIPKNCDGRVVRLVVAGGRNCSRDRSRRGAGSDSRTCNFGGRC